MISPQTMLLSLRANTVPATSLPRAGCAFLSACMRPMALLLLCAISMAVLTAPAHAQSEQTLVSNIGQGQDVFILRQQGAYQAFTTGNNALGYDLTSVEVYFTSDSSSASHITASLHRMDSGEPGNKVADLANPDKIVSGSNVFTVPAGTVLGAGTDYAVVFSISGNWNLGGTYSRREDSGSQSDWSIEDTYYNLVGSVFTAPLGRFSVMIRLNGIVRQPPSDDATLSALRLTVPGGGDVDLDPAFTADGLEYTTLVPNRVASITLDASANHPGAGLKFLDGKELELTDMDPDTGGFQAGLLVGENVFKVQVEAENGEKRIYTVNVTRQGGPLTLELHAIAADDVVNAREKADGFAITGHAGTMEMNGMDSISVTVDIGSETLTAATDSNGEWSVNVPPDADYISEPGVTVTVNASGPHLSTAPELTRDLKVDLTPPALVSVVVDGDRLTLTFDEALAERAVSPDNFSVSVNGEVLSGQIAVAPGGNTVTLLLDLPVTVSAGDTVRLSYTGPEGSGPNSIFDPAGNEVQPLSDYQVENGTPIGERCAGSEGSIRLMDGSDEQEGRVEICADADTGDNTPASWGTVCDDYWTNEDADVACMALGYEGSEPDAGRFRRSRFGAGPGPIWLDDMRCAGNESSLLDCPLAGGRRARDSIGVHNCKSTEVVGVRCMAAGEERTLSVADATAEEGAQLAFRVTLNQAADWEVSVTYLTWDVTTTAGSDYEDVSGTLTFAAGETEKTVTVVTLDDAVDDDGETLMLRLRYAFGARIEDGKATGTIHNSDPLPQAWLGRFGRTGAVHVVAMLNARFDEAAGAGNRLSLGGQAMDLRPSPAYGTRGQAFPQHMSPYALRGEREASETARPGGTPANDGSGHAPGWPEPDAVPGAAAAAVETAGAEATPLEHALWNLLTDSNLQFDTRRFLSQSSFNLSLSGSSPAYLERGQEPIETIAAAPESPGRWSLWGRGALTHFGGVDEGVNLDGDVLTGLLGLDYARNRWLAGIALAYHDGNGSYRSTRNAGAGDLDSTLVSVNPYLRYALTDRLSVWGTLGYGTGTLQLRQESRGQGQMGTELNSVPGESAGTGAGLPSGPGAAPRRQVIETDMSLAMGALGLRGVIYASAGTELALKTDALWVRTSSDATDGMQGARADSSRLRLLLAGRHQRVLANDALLSPSIELGLRYDDGDAETGFGMELGGGLRYADALLGLTVETKARALLAHEDGGYEEWGVGGSLSLDPGRLGRGLALRLDTGWGLAESSAEALWQRQTTAGIAPQHDPSAQGRLSAELGYGLDMPWSYGILTPYSGMEWAGASRTLRLGWRFTLGRPHAYGVQGQALHLSLDGERREDGHSPPEHILMLRASLPW